MRAISKKRARLLREHRKIRQQVFERDGGCVAARLDFGPCFGPLTPHHLRKASQGGSYELSNLVALCQAHNDRVEDEPAKARSLGLVRLRVAEDGVAPTGRGEARA